MQLRCPQADRGGGCPARALHHWRQPPPGAGPRHSEGGNAMWWGQPKQASSATMSIVYITVGALTDVWTIIYYIYLGRHGADDNTYLWVSGFFFTGIVLMTIGFALGWI